LNTKVFNCPRPPDSSRYNELPAVGIFPFWHKVGYDLQVLQLS